MTLNEVFEALGRGDKIRASFWSAGEYICLRDEKILTQSGAIFSPSNVMRDHKLFELYTEPKTKTHYRKPLAMETWRTVNGYVDTWNPNPCWAPSKEDFEERYPKSRGEWEEKEIEV